MSWSGWGGPSLWRPWGLSWLVPEVCSIFCATANELELVVAESALGRGIIGVIDGQMPVGVEQDEDVQKRRGFLRKIGYKL